jgi:hypothetical protein
MLLADTASTVAELQFGPDLWWQAPLLLIIVLIGSSAGSVLAERFLPSRSERVKALREGGTETLDALQVFHEAIYRQNAKTTATDDETINLVKLGSAVLVGAAKTGDAEIRKAVGDYTFKGRNWAVHRPGPTFASFAVEKSYEDALTVIADFMRKNR